MNPTPPLPSRSPGRASFRPPAPARLARSALAGLQTAAALANPGAPVVLQGTATVQSSGPVLEVTASHNAFLSWSSFNIGPGETTRFVQPDAGSVVWNRITDPEPSRVFGNLEANGMVVLANARGFYFGPTAFVKTGGLLLTTAPVAPPDFGSTSPWNVTAVPPSAAIVNFGRIEVGHGGSAYLIADHIENHGEIRAHEGEVGLFAGREVLLSERPDGRGLSARVRLPEGSVDNTGRILADGGTIAAHARVVNQDGLIEANSVREHQGIIELVAEDDLTLSSHSALSARGDEMGSSRGGQVTLTAGNAFADASGSTISVAGGREAGGGGSVHLSAPKLPAIHSTIEAAGHGGEPGGQLRLDPTDIIIASGGGSEAGSGTVPPDAPPETLRLDASTAFAGFSQITLQATRDIRVEQAWNLNESTGVSAPESLLTLQAGRDLRVQNAGIVAGEGWSVRFEAGYDFRTGQVQPGVGGIYFEGSGSLEAANGSIRLTAGSEVLVNAGFVRTVGGGDIQVQALSGDIDTGTKTGGFRFGTTGSGYEVDVRNLGGISTGAGGSVTLTAGRDVRSYRPTLQGNHGDGGAGAFGAQPGDVTVHAGRNVTGHFVLRNGEGTIEAPQGSAGRVNDQLALSLVQGTWTVAAQDIALQEVRNPNGIFNRAGALTAPTRHQFDYDPEAGVVLRAANSVNLVGGALPRNTGNDELLPILYPPRFDVEAGAGGIVLGNNLTLFPSAQGDLRLKTSGGGDLRTTREGLSFTLLMSESDARRYTKPQDFGLYAHGAAPLHLADSEPLHLNIAGDVRDLLFAVPKAIELLVGGDFINSTLLGQNLRATDVTELRVQGDIFNRNRFTFTFLNEVGPDVIPNLLALGIAVDPVATGLFGRVFYNPATTRLALADRLTPRELAALKNLTVLTFPEYGQPYFDERGNLVRPAAPLTDEQGNLLTATVRFLPESVLNDLFARSQDVPDTAPEGYQVGGPGLLRVEARNLDLGFSKGIVSGGPKYNPALAELATRGSDVEVSLRGDLNMFSSNVRVLNGGTISIHAEGEINVGDPSLDFNPEVARGIYTVGASDVTVVAGGNINVGGSRIATYDGGNIVLRSEHGNVDAGVGALGYVRVERITVDPETRALGLEVRAIPGSGILATSFPDSESSLGNITIETPQGDIIANQGGIIQLALSGREVLDAHVTLRAGSVLTDEHGVPVLDEHGKETVLHRGRISAGESGVIGANVSLKATGDISGVVVAQKDIDVSSVQNITVTAVASGAVNVSAGGNVSGTIVAIGGISAAGENVSASLVSDTVSASGNVTSAVGFTEASVSAASAQRVESEESTTAKTTAKVAPQEEEEDAKGRPRPLLARAVSRVTVLLPGR